MPDLLQSSPANQLRGRYGQIVGPRIDGAERVELLLEAGDVELLDPLRGREILEPMLAEIAEGDAIWHVARDERGCRFG